MADLGVHPVRLGELVQVNTVIAALLAIELHHPAVGGPAPLRRLITDWQGASPDDVCHLRRCRGVGNPLTTPLHASGMAVARRDVRQTDILLAAVDLGSFANLPAQVLHRRRTCVSTSVRATSVERRNESLWVTSD